MTNATVQSVDGSAVVLSHTAEPLARRLGEQRNAEAIAAALHELLGGTWQVRCVHAGAVDEAPKQAPRQQQAQQQRPPQNPQRQFRRPEPAAGNGAAGNGGAAKAAAPERPERRPQPVATEPDIPLPPEPEEDEDLYTEEPSSLAPSAPQGPDPHEEAHRLLSDHLGARPLE